MRFVLLGQLEAIDGDRSLALGGPKQRTLLAVLLLHANEPVSRDRLIEIVWGEQPPANPEQTLDSTVSRLRRLLGTGRIETRGRSYRLRIEPGELDLHEFEQLAATGRYRESLACWNGPALGDLASEPFLQEQAERIEEQRLGALEERIDDDLSAGVDAGLVGELDALVRAHPLRERLLGQLMLALYRTGRQAAALEAFRAAQRRFSDELGLALGPQLQDLERRILAHDPELGGACEAVPPPLPPLPRSRPHAPRVPWVVIAVVAVVAVAAAIGVMTASGGSRGAAGVSDRSSRLVALTASGPVRARKLPGAPGAATVADGSIWLTDPSGQAVLRADAPSGAVVDRVPLNLEPDAIVAGGGAIWVASNTARSVERIDPATDGITQTIHLGGGDVTAIAYADGDLWVADSTDQAIIEVDPNTGAALRTVSLDIHPTALVVGRDVLWVADYDAATVTEVDAQSGETLGSALPVGNGPSALLLAGGRLWIANSEDSTVTAIDPDTDRTLATLPVGSGPAALAATSGAVWVANQYTGTVSRIDPARLAVDETVRVGGEPLTLAATPQAIWVGESPSATAHRGGTLRLVSSGPWQTIDPAFQFTADAPFTRLAYDTLVTFRATGGPAGLDLVPDLALAVPTPTEGNTVYTFRLRPGIRYSNGRLLRADDFRRAIERQFLAGGAGATYFTGIVGAAQCTRRRCDLSRGIVTDDRAATVSFHLIAPDPDFLQKLTVEGFSAPIPPGIPNHDVGSHAVPGTGPYRIASFVHGNVRFVRNTYFHEWSHAAQPSGNPDSIVWRAAPSNAAATREVEQGRADFTFWVDLKQLTRLEIDHPGQLYLNPSFLVEYLQVNTHLAPFNSLRVRQAINYAIDRNVIAHLYGGSAIATPLCQPLAPRLPGYRRYCPYTINPRPNGLYTGPNLARARRLVAASGTRGEHVTVWGAPDEGTVPPRLSAYIGSVLRKLGYRTSVRLVRHANISNSMRRGFQLSTDGDWMPDFPTPSSYLPLMFGCDGALSNGYVCDRRLDADMARASLLEITSPAQASALWNRIDHYVTNHAYWVPTVNLGNAELVSSRLGHYEFNPAEDFLADQAWVR